MNSYLSFFFYSFLIIGGLLVIGYCLSIEPVTITSLPPSMMCEADPIIDQYICYQP